MWKIHILARNFISVRAQQTTTMPRALLTDREREILSGNATDVANPNKYQSNTRNRVRDRLKRIEQDIAVLEEHEPELAKELRESICIGSETRALRDVLDDIQDDLEQLKTQTDDS